MPIKVDNKYLVPAPLVSFEKRTTIDGNGTTIGSEYDINLEGTLIPVKGNPIVSGGSGVFSTDSWVSSYDANDDPLTSVSGSLLLEHMMLKQEQIRDLFTSSSGVKVEILSFENDKGIKFFGRVNNISFNSDGRWANPNSYSVSLTASNFLESVGSNVFSNNSTEDGFTYYVESVDESWSIQEGDFKTSNIDDITSMVKTYSVTHNLSAQGKVAYDENGDYLNGLTPWQQASGYVHNILGVGSDNLPTGLYIDPSTGSSFDGFTIANRVFDENADIRGGNYNLTETFLLVDSGILENGFAVENVTIETSEDNQNSLKTVNINGSINGLSLLTSSNSGVDEYSNALTYFNNLGSDNFYEDKIYLRAKTLSGYNWLNPKPLNSSITKAPSDGTISYNYSYNTRMPTVVSGALSESITISDTYPGQNFSVIPVIGVNQQVIQSLNSRSEYKRSLSSNAVLPLSANYSSGVVDSSGYWSAATSGDINNWLITQKPSVVNSTDFQKIYDAANPANEAGVVNNKVFYSAPQESWNPFNGQYTYTIEWTYKKES